MAIKTFSFKNDKNKYCSAHTQVKELASKSGTKLYSDTVLIDTELLELIEKLFKKLKCKKYIISSGYRTAAHDKAVGGSGNGQHTLGRAIDACFYDKNNKIISAKIVCCVAQDLGFKGIANISKNYKYVHLDNRASGSYKGDEIKGYNTVTTDFYKYFGITKAQVEAYTGGASVSKIVNIGDKVKLATGATYYNGSSIPLWVKLSTLYVREIKGDRVVISTSSKGAITGAVNKKYLIKK